MYSSDDSKDPTALGVNAFVDAAPLAYVRPVKTERGIGYGVYAADGTQLAVFGTREAAYFAAKQHDLEPVLIH